MRCYLCPRNDGWCDAIHLAPLKGHAFLSEALWQRVTWRMKYGSQIQTYIKSIEDARDWPVLLGLTGCYGASSLCLFLWYFARSEAIPSYVSKEIMEHLNSCRRYHGQFVRRKSKWVFHGKYTTLMPLVFQYSLWD